MLTPPEFPNFEYILNNETEKLTTEQSDWYNLLRLVDSFYFLLNDKCGLIQRTQGGYNNIPLSSYLNAMAEVAWIGCDKPNRFRQDEFTKVAEESNLALTKIVMSPRTKLQREPSKLHVSKVREITPQTIKWLAQRPQEEIADKIKPSNTILTHRVVFSTNTTENQTLKYFYGRLHKYITAMFEKTDCMTCAIADNCGIIGGINSFLRLNNRIRQTELSGVVAKLAVIPNNALLSDKYYNAIWRATLRLRKAEERIKELWMVLPQYLLQLELLIKAITLVVKKQGRVFEMVVSYADGKGLVYRGVPVQRICIEYGCNSTVTVEIDGNQIVESETTYV